VDCFQLGDDLDGVDVRSYFRVNHSVTAMNRGVHEPEAPNDLRYLSSTTCADALQNRPWSLECTYHRGRQPFGGRSMATAHCRDTPGMAGQFRGIL
jgi:hypothetical protein